MSEENRSTPGAPGPLALGPLLLIGGIVGAALIAMAGRYGYHRDELYFLVAADHLSWGYPDQGPATPAIAALADAIVPGSLTVLRVPSALMTGATIVLTGLMARELGGTRRAQVLAAVSVAAAGVILAVGHLLSTTTFDLLAWAGLTFLAVRAVRTGDDRVWLAIGLLVGLALLNKPLIGFLVAAMGAGVVIAGPRRLLRSPWVWSGAVVALAMWSPWLVWQALESWPQLEVARRIAQGGSVSSQPRLLFLPFQLLIAGPLLAPIWLTGLLGLLRSARLRPYRFLGWAWLVLAAAFLALGGKPYYMAGLLPLLFAAGALTMDGWLDRGRGTLRRGALAAVLLLSATTATFIGLPVLPERNVDPVLAVNPDVAETIGWPELAGQVAQIGLPGRAVILTSNYGEAGALDRYGPALGLPQSYSGHNALWEWGPPPEGSGPVLLVGFADAAFVARSFDGCQTVGSVGNRAGVDNQELGRPIRLCTGPARPWGVLWPSLRHLG